MTDPDYDRAAPWTAAAAGSLLLALAAAAPLHAQPGEGDESCSALHEQAERYAGQFGAGDPVPWAYGLTPERAAEGQIEEDRLVFTRDASPWVGCVGENDVLWSPMGVDSYLRRVVDVEAEDGRVVLRTIPAGFGDLLSRGRVEAGGEGRAAPDPGGAAERPTPPDPPKAGVFGEGPRILFLRSGGLWIVDRDGAGAETVRYYAADPPRHPRWSPDGSRLSFVRGDSLQVAEADFGVRTVAALSPARVDGEGAALARGATWLPGGERLVVQHATPGPAGPAASAVDVHVLEADGSGRTCLGPFADLELFPAASPVDGRIAFVRATQAAGVSTAAEEPCGPPTPGVAEEVSPFMQSSQSVWVMGPDGSDPTRLVAAGDDRYVDLEWSPDGEWVAFAVRDGEEWAIGRTPADGDGFVERLAVFDEEVRHPTWSPGGEALAFVRRGADGERHLHLLDLGTGDVRRLVEGPADQPAWRPWPSPGR